MGNVAGALSESRPMRRETSLEASFVERHGLWTAAMHDAARQVVAEAKRLHLEVVRFSFPDQHGLLRGKTLTVSELEQAMVYGVAVPTSLIAKDTAHRTVFPVFSTGGGFDMPEMQGAADMLMIADPRSFRVLPWASNAGWLLCDIYFADGRSVPFSTRQICRRVLQSLDQAGYDYIAGLEVEFHAFRLLRRHMQPADAGQPGEPPDVELLSHGYQYLTELRFDQVEPVIEMLRREIAPLGFPLRSLEIEYGPSQFEFTFGPMAGMEAADAMVLFRSAVKQICARNGYHATFMCRPRMPEVMSNGWHLHQSLRSKSTGSNAFAVPDGGGVSTVCRHYLAGLLKHAKACTALATPTINGYKRYRPYSLAPDRISWGRDNRGAMVRLVEGVQPGAIRLENRTGEPAANPYLYFASQILAGLDGMANKLDPGPSADTPYEAAVEHLPRTLANALVHLREDECLREGLGEDFVNYFCRIKEAEVARFDLAVTDWEHREYFEIF